MTTRAIDWPAVHAEALEILRAYLRIDTTNPPGNEAPAARYLGALMAAEGIPVEYIETAPGREVVVGRLAGDGSKRGLMLGNHLDVVPVEAEFWTKPPFEGVVEDGRIYGRGAMDMKSCGVMQVVTMLLLKRLRTPLKRDVVFVGVPDEEAGGALGMGYLCEHRPDVVDVEFALNEGGSGRTTNGRTMFNVATNEKFGAGLTLTAVGQPGHGSFFHNDNSMVRLARALVRLDEWNRGVTYIPDTRAYLERMVAAGVFEGGGDAVLEAQIRARNGMRPMFMNTLNVTVVRAGVKTNVLPARSEANLDCRLLPGQDPEQWRREVERVVDDPSISVAFTSGRTPVQQPQVPWDTELFHAIEASVHAAMEDAVVTPSMTIGITDSRYLRARGVAAYGFIPAIFSSEENRTFHGNDEFITIENLNLGCELTYDIVRRVCA
ncbi:MAG: M20/M25/M40 family metallo-hydrolase [Dehalococcoidia bacterium]|nr:M20/M25/M40 family metallo-hydrolase [Dehalococcoidia bacterium]